MEKLILDNLNWDLNFVTPSLMIYHFLPFFEIPYGLEGYVYRQAQNMVNMMHSQYEFLQYLPSELAMVSIYCALKLCALEDDIFQNVLCELSSSFLYLIRRRQIALCCKKMISCIGPKLRAEINWETDRLSAP
jgi:hypothetical protein